MNWLPVKMLALIFSLLINGANAQLPSSVDKVFVLRNDRKNKMDSLADIIENQTQFRFHTGYTNKVIFAGRNFGVNQSGEIFGASYHHRSGITLEYEGSCWNGMPNQYAMTEVGAYAERSLSDNFYLTAGYWHLSYTNGDEHDRNLFTNFFLLDESWFTSLGQLNASYYFIKGSETAHRLDLNLSHAIDFYNHPYTAKITVEPTLAVTLSTVNYITFLSSLTEFNGSDPTSFRVANYEAILPVTYKKPGRYELKMSWHRAWPVPLPGEKILPVSYFTIEFARMLLLK